tara:strand:- start:211 stop:600 length:390 start_codon:yes stop_codon:yes gene_type:complete
MSHADNPEGSSAEPLTKQDLSECMRQVIGNVKDYLDLNIDRFKSENDRLMQSTSNQVAELKKSADLQFKRKGNKVQFLFNAGILDQIAQAEEYSSEGRAQETQVELEKITAALKKRNKLIRLADKSEEG